MGILLAFKDASWIAAHIVPSFRELSLPVTVYNFRGKNKETNTSSILSICERNEIEIIFFVEADDNVIDLNSLLSLRSKGVRILNYLVDVPQSWWTCMRIADGIDYILCAQEKNSQRLKRPSNSVIGFPFAVSYDFASNAVEAVSRLRLSRPVGPLFIGSAHSRWRRDFVNALVGQGVNLSVVGAGWTQETVTSGTNVAEYFGTFGLRYQVERVLGSGLAPICGAVLNKLLPTPAINSNAVQLLGKLGDAELSELAASAEVLVSTSVHGSGYLVGSTERQVKLRDVEMLCYGRPYLSDYPRDERYAFPELHINFYNTIEEIPAAIEDIRNNYTRETDLAAENVQIVLKRHTWRNRFRYLSEQTGISFI